MLSAGNLAKNAIGTDHIWTAEIYSQIALMYEEENTDQLASIWIRKSFMSCYKAVGLGHRALKVVYSHLKNIENKVDSPLATLPIEHIRSKIKQLEYSQK